ncbi:MAG: 5'-nucleotidase C-terminal domain-containing protein [Acidobacteriota bacterium]|nr:5'-nucleotidase C-terminal domain-containing protein [Acidobacteriota bacterium]
MSSLSARLLLSVSLLLLFFFGATIVVLDTAFREAGEQAQEDILDGQLMALLAAAEPNIYGELEMPPTLPEPRFGALDSGLYGQLRDDSDTPVWKSPSALGLELPYGEPPPLGTHRFSRIELEDGTPIDPGATYTVTVNDFMAIGGSGYTMFLDADDVVDTGIVDVEALVRYLEGRPRPAAIPRDARWIAAGEDPR